MKSGWQTKLLSEVLVKTETVNPTLKPNEEFEYVDVSSVSNTTFQIDQTQTVKGKDAPSRARKLVRANDVLFATIRPTLQRIAIVPEELDQQVCSTGYFVLRPSAKINFRYLYYFLFTDEFMGAMQTLQKGASYPAVTDGEVKAQAISYPPLPDQQRIVTILDEAFEGIAAATANAEKNLNNARELFDGVLWNVQGEHASLGQYVDITTGKLDANAAVDGGVYPFFTCSRQIYAIDKYAFDCEAILLAGNNASGDFNVKHYKGKFNAYQRTYVITVKDETNLLYRYLYFQMINSLKSFKRQAVGTNTKFLKLPMIKELKIPLPSFSKQRSIVAMLDDLSAERTSLELAYQQKLALLAELKKSILHQAFTGQLH